MNVYHVRKFLSGSSVSKMAENTSEMMTAWVAFPRPKRMKISIIINQHYYRALKRTRFQFVEAVKEKAARVMQELTEKDFQYCFEQWWIRMERCRDRGGVYIEGDND